MLCKPRSTKPVAVNVNEDDDVLGLGDDEGVGYVVLSMVNADKNIPVVCLFFLPSLGRE
jgi:hypothetical protein